MSAVQQASPIELSQAAQEKIRELLLEEADDELCLRVFVTGGGCSGFQYGFTFDDERAEDDTLISMDGVRVLVDPLSYGYLVGSVLDYKEGLEGSRFMVNNPGASSTCGCGSSFSI
ncbi:MULTISPECIES: iron-sulfur cluster insertion protein ErpA [Oceanospirillaceae]|jgi:iron-sulfur cluster insertion protein|uniref:iron-sulfur cluster insertion protein ErpA n=1 Tax=Oceanospirillaceae TaxID=135620 RepID=UPI000C5F76F8|nr:MULTISPECIES: iron-sulfur cluster insertion protein ErpA [Thalassolituus]PIQ40305.1 MAG: iron-sulfur cluster insertion protein ErpA [Thalassolituus sp. CG17_big_fil_post_rev_8_21_14_2_50_53_8]MCA6059300.1 iron-sulfur cluster insertion protein ErpA [Thalassolituus sp. ST750PaO-4]MCB2386118.1 iron-sulfur cluster insertion protein ErpA [Thalassolituus alkanivorans]MCB2423107.1 iron-sulfur cluster insertion protein ErpA [Thalassolituus alkanivorans]TVV44372.1 iron-sulfur cluster insertion prote|tara:strand:+ start:547 stop:894 length:348 start_codon:yes stop_codon:yes gene_type:complete